MIPRTKMSTLSQDAIKVSLRPTTQPRQVPMTSNRPLSPGPGSSSPMATPSPNGNRPLSPSPVQRATPPALQNRPLSPSPGSSPGLHNRPLSPSPGSSPGSESQNRSMSPSPSSSPGSFSPQRTPRSRPPLAGQRPPQTSSTPISITSISPDTSNRPTPVSAVTPPKASSGRQCDRCEGAAATVACHDCLGKPYCSDCNQVIHGKGKWQTHDVVPIGSYVARAPSSFQQAQIPSSPRGTTPSSPRGMTPSSPRVPAPSQGSTVVTSQVPPAAMMMGGGRRPSNAASMVHVGPVNENVQVDWAAEGPKMVPLKEQFIDDVMDMLMGVALSYLMEGVFLKDQQQISYYFRLDEEQSQLSYGQVNPSTFVKGSSTPIPNPLTINISDILELTEVSNSTTSAFTMSLKSRASMTLSTENREQFVYIFDGLRCLIGLEMKTRQMQTSLSGLTEVLALESIYKPPAVPDKPSNYNFITAI